MKEVMNWYKYGMFARYLLKACESQDDVTLFKLKGFFVGQEEENKPRNSSKS